MKSAAENKKISININFNINNTENKKGNQQISGDHFLQKQLGKAIKKENSVSGRKINNNEVNLQDSLTSDNIKKFPIPIEFAKQRIKNSVETQETTRFDVSGNEEPALRAEAEDAKTKRLGQYSYYSNIAKPPLDENNKSGLTKKPEGQETALKAEKKKGSSSRSKLIKINNYMTETGEGQFEKKQFPPAINQEATLPKSGHHVSKQASQATGKAEITDMNHIYKELIAHMEPYLTKLIQEQKEREKHKLNNELKSILKRVIRETSRKKKKKHKGGGSSSLDSKSPRKNSPGEKIHKPNVKNEGKISKSPIEKKGQHVGKQEIQKKEYREKSPNAKQESLKAIPKVTVENLRRNKELQERKKAEEIEAQVQNFKKKKEQELQNTEIRELNSKRFKKKTFKNEHPWGFDQKKEEKRQDFEYQAEKMLISRKPARDEEFERRNVLGLNFLNNLEKKSRDKLIKSKFSPTESRSPAEEKVNDNRSVERKKRNEEELEKVRLYMELKKRKDEEENQRQKYELYLLREKKKPICSFWKKKSERGSRKILMVSRVLCQKGARTMVQQAN